jgi:hypothetical protein
MVVIPLAGEEASGAGEGPSLITSDGNVRAAEQRTKHYTVVTFCLDTKKRERGRAWPRRQSAESRTVSNKMLVLYYRTCGSLLASSLNTDFCS